jgi:hypothetical protein
MHYCKTRSDLLLDGKLASAAILAFGFVDSSIGTAADEAYNLVALRDPLLVVVPSKHGMNGIYRVFRNRFSIRFKTLK